MLKLYANLFCIVIQILGVLGKPPVNHTNPTTAKPISDILKKFHQNDFRLVYERSELARVDKRYADCEFRTFKYNRTTPVLNASCIFTIDVGYDMEIIIQVYKFASNEYRTFPIHFQINLCDGISSSAMGFDKFVQSGNIACPLIKGKKYYVNYFTPDPERFPPFIPSGHYMLETQYYYQSKECFTSYSYGIIDRPIPIPDS